MVRGTTGGVGHDKIKSKGKGTIMGRMIDVVAEWPELFEGLDERDTEGIRAACASSQLEGRAPTFEGVADLVANARGEITHEEFIARAIVRAEAQVGRSAR